MENLEQKLQNMTYQLENLTKTCSSLSEKVDIIEKRLLYNKEIVDPDNIGCKAFDECEFNVSQCHFCKIHFEVCPLH